MGARGEERFSDALSQCSLLPRAEAHPDRKKDDEGIRYMLVSKHLLWCVGLGGKRWGASPS